MKLSIITINYNNAEGLRKTLASVASQTYPHIEHIIVDGGSTDGSVEIICEYADNQAKGERLEVKGTENNKVDVLASTPYTIHHTPPTHVVRWISEPDAGIYNAMNKGIEIALGRREVREDHTSTPIANQPILNPSLKGRTSYTAEQSPLPLGRVGVGSDYIQILNSGDILAAPDVTERMVFALQQCNSTANCVSDIQKWVPIFYGNMIKEWPDGRRVKDNCGGNSTTISFYYFYRGTLNHDCAYIRKDLFEKYGLYNEDMRICSDWEWYVRAIVLGEEKTVYTNIDVTVFDMTGVSESDGKNRELIQKERRGYLESILPNAVLRDYDILSLPIEQYRRLKKYHLWGIVYFVERVLFKFEKWFKK